MCTGLEAAAIAAMVGGTAIKSREESRAAKRVQSAIETGNKNQDVYANQKRDLVLKNLKQYDPTSRATDQTTAQNTATDTLAKAVGDATGGRGTEATGKVSSDYLTGEASSKANELKRSSILATLMGKVRGPTDLRFNENLKNAQFGSQAAGVGANANIQARADALKAQRTGQVDPRVMLLGQLLSTGGQAYATGSFKNPKPQYRTFDTQPGTGYD